MSISMPRDWVSSGCMQKSSRITHDALPVSQYRAFSLGYSELAHQFGRTCIHFLTGLITKRNGLIILARSCRSRNDEVLVVAHELHSSKASDLIAVEAPLEGIANIIQCSVVTELGGSDNPLHSSVFTIVTRFAPSVRRTGTASSL